MKTPAFVLMALAVSASAFSQTSVPAAPTLTAGAEFKGLRFDWDTVAGATWYQLEYRAHQTGDFAQIGDDYPATATSTHFSFPVHLYDWTNARYRLAACNSAGCSRSATVSVSNLRLDAVGYFKSSQPQAEALFGASGDLSPDGYNFAVAAPQENHTETGAFLTGGAAYVFRRGSNGKWFQRARLAVNDYVWAMDGLDLAVATSGSGNTIAVGLASYSVNSQEGGGPWGEVDVYHAKPGSGSYTHTRIPRPAVNSFATSVALSESGYILAVGVTDAQMSAAIYKLVNGAWQNVRNLPGSPDGTELCLAPVMSRDGKTIAQLCRTFATPARAYVRVYSGSNWVVRTDIDLETAASGRLEWGHNGISIDSAGNTIAVQFSKGLDPFPNGTAEVRVYKRGSTGFTQVARLTPGAWRTQDRGYEYGTKLSLSGDGQTLAVGDSYDNGTGTGPRAAPLVSGTTQTGAVYVYRLSSTWKLANVVKPNYLPISPGAWGFGWVVSLSQSGKTLLIPVGNESSSAKGIDGNWANADLHRSGAAFLY